MTGAHSKNSAQVFVIDRSKSFVQRLGEILRLLPDLELAGWASDPYMAAEKLKHLRPDVLILDVDLPRMDGLTFLAKLMTQHPMPVVVCSQSQSRERARPLGAQVVKKPETKGEKSRALWEGLIRALRSSAGFEPEVNSNEVHEEEDRANNSPDLLLPKFHPQKIFQGKANPLIVIGASTGGTEALEVVLSEFPPDAPATAVVQHMPGEFTRGFAERLDKACLVRVQEAKAGLPFSRGEVVIAPGRTHLLVRRAPAGWVCELRDGPPITRHKPSANVLFRSAVFSGGKSVVGAVLTGMGADGAIGLSELRKAGCRTVAQDEKTSVVFGMRKEAIRLGGAEYILPLNKVAAFLLNSAGSHCGGSARKQ